MDHVRVRSLKIYNQLGQLVMRLSDAGQRSLDMRRQPPGVYFLRIDTDVNPFFTKIWKR